jgi:hypothetical protein
VAELFASARIVDFIVALMLIELAILAFVRSRRHRGIAAAELSVSLAAGIGLLLALRASLLRLSWQHVAMWLIVALIAHVLYLTLRWDAD